MARSIWNGTITFGLVAVPGTRDEGRDAYALLHAALEQALAEIKG